MKSVDLHRATDLSPTDLESHRLWIKLDKLPLNQFMIDLPSENQTKYI